MWIAATVVMLHLLTLNYYATQDMVRLASTGDRMGLDSMGWDTSPQIGVLLPSESVLACGLLLHEVCH